MNTIAVNYDNISRENFVIGFLNQACTGHRLAIYAPGFFKMLPSTDVCIHTVCVRVRACVCVSLHPQGYH